MLIDNPCKRLCIEKARETLRVRDKAKWYDSLMDDSKNVLNGNKLRTYRQFKNTLETEPYVLANISRYQRRILAKFRCGNLPLHVETGRYTKPKTPLSDRLCKYCTLNLVEDETHFLINCDFYDDIRLNLFTLASSFDNAFSDFTTTEKLIFLMKTPELQGQTAKTLHAMFRRRQLCLPV